MMEKLSLNKCNLCPRKCNVDRDENLGYCGESNQIKIARADLHYWEEPCISSEKGSGTVFFSGCNLKCCFCQNFEISAQNKGFNITEEQLAKTFLMLQDKGAENINLVNPTHFVLQIINALNLCKDKLKIPVVYNSGGYESVETIVMLKGHIDIFLPDLKYFDSTLSLKYSKAENYFEKASKAIKAMVEIVGTPTFNHLGVLTRGVVVRHLVLPSCRHDSIKIIHWLNENFAKNEIIISLMSQFTPVYKAANFKEINRKTTTFEYNSVLAELEKTDFKGFTQLKSSADKDYIPEFFHRIYYNIPNNL